MARVFYRDKSSGAGSAMTTPLDSDLVTLLEAFDDFCARARRRLVAGHERYGQAWRTRDNLAELCEEAEDAFCYGFFDWLRAREVGGRRWR